MVTIRFEFGVRRQRARAKPLRPRSAYICAATVARAGISTSQSRKHWAGALVLADNAVLQYFTAAPSSVEIAVADKYATRLLHDLVAHFYYRFEALGVTRKDFVIPTLISMGCDLCQVA